MITSRVQGTGLCKYEYVHKPILLVLGSYLHRVPNVVVGFLYLQPDLLLYCSLKITIDSFIFDDIKTMISLSKELLMLSVLLISSICLQNTVNIKSRGSAHRNQMLSFLFPSCHIPSTQSYVLNSLKICIKKKFYPISLNPLEQYQCICKSHTQKMLCNFTCCVWIKLLTRFLNFFRQIQIQIRL